MQTKQQQQKKIQSANDGGGDDDDDVNKVSMKQGAHKLKTNIHTSNTQIVWAQSEKNTPQINLTRKWQWSFAKWMGLRISWFDALVAMIGPCFFLLLLHFCWFNLFIQIYQELKKRRFQIENNSNHSVTLQLLLKQKHTMFQSAFFSSCPCNAVNSMFKDNFYFYENKLKNWNYTSLFLIPFFLDHSSIEVVIACLQMQKSNVLFY